MVKKKKKKKPPTAQYIHFNKDIESIKVDLSKAKNNLIKCENENHQIKEEAKRLAKDITTIREMYDAYKESEANNMHMKVNTSKIQKAYAKMILKYVEGEDANDDDDE
jgi:regulator of replication initiation timing